jgi:predicted pyridoxine 5'-phosphate oxidase superfamily flavin-nucleotide-binding protein
MIQMLPNEVTDAWQHRAGPCVLATVSTTGRPNAIYVGVVQRHGNKNIMIGDVHFSKTRQNIADGSRGSLLFITGEKKSYQLKGRFTVHTEGAEFDHLKSWIDPKHSPHAAVVLHVEQVFQGANEFA